MSKKLYESMDRTTAGYICTALDEVQIAYQVTGLSDIGGDQFAMPVCILVDESDFEDAVQVIDDKGLLPSGKPMREFSRWEKIWLKFVFLSFPVLLGLPFIVRGRGLYISYGVYGSIGLLIYILYKKERSKNSQ